MSILKDMMATLNGCHQNITRYQHPKEKKLKNTLLKIIRGKYTCLTFGYRSQLSIFKCNLCGDIFKCRAIKMIRLPGYILCPSCAKNVYYTLKHKNKFIPYSVLFNKTNQRLIKSGKFKKTPYYKKHLQILNIRHVSYGTSVLNDYKQYKCLTLKCDKCHTVFTRINENIDKDPIRCPKCSKHMSTGELRTMNYLNSKSINYEYGYVTNIRYKYKLHFDFWLPKYQIAIEYDGIQHFKPINHFGGINSFKTIRKRDSVKDKYCKDHNIKLIRIAYTQSINKILDENLNRQLNLF